MQIKKMGPLSGLVSMLPGIPKEVRDVEIDDGQTGQVEAIIRSMTVRAAPLRDHRRAPGKPHRGRLGHRPQRGQPAHQAVPGDEQDDEAAWAASARRSTRAARVGRAAAAVGSPRVGRRCGSNLDDPRGSPRSAEGWQASRQGQGGLPTGLPGLDSSVQFELALRSDAPWLVAWSASPIPHTDRRSAHQPGRAGSWQPRERINVVKLPDADGQEEATPPSVVAADARSPQRPRSSRSSAPTSRARAVRSFRSATTRPSPG